MNDQSNEFRDGKRPLEGLKVLITRPNYQAGPFAKRLVELGASVTSHPVVRVGAPPDPQHVADCLGRLNDFSVAAFLSKNAAIAFAKALSVRDRKQQLPPISAIGSGTKSTLEQRGYSVQFLPEHANSESMAETLISRYRRNGHSKPILILRADRGSEVLPDALTRERIDFEELAIYQSLDVEEADPAVLQSLAAGEFHWLTVTSPAIASNVASLFGAVIGDCKVASISPKTTAAAKESGLQVSAEAEAYNADGVIAAIIKHQRAK